MPQAAKQKDTEAEKAAREQAEQEWAELVASASEGDTPAARQIKRALKLEKEISALRKRVNDNRDYLRLMHRNDELTDDQVEFVEVFYPEKEKGERRSAEEVEATRRAREAARKNGGE
jgi:hypothetical protein